MQHTEASEQQNTDHANTTKLNMRKLLMWVFLGSDCLFFGAFIATYMLYRNSSLVGPYPQEILSIPVTSASTFILLTSSLAMVLALTAFQRGNTSAARFWLFSTAFLGCTFLGFQVFEFYTFVEEGLTPQTNLFGATFFTLTGFHGFHVMLGVIWLFSLLGVSMTRGIPAEKSLDVELAGLYWHFVDIVWIVIFTVVYLLSSLPSASSH